MPLPTVVFNSSTGSDTAASGYGPATAVSGTGAATTAASAVVTVSADSPNLSTITNGDLLWVDSSSGRQFSIISSYDNTAKTITCADTFANTESGKNWGVGGKRATFDNADSRTLFSATGVKPGWTITTETDQPLTSSELVCDGGTVSVTDGAITIQGDSTTTRRVISQSASDQCFTFNVSVQNWKIKNLHFKNSNGTKTNAQAFSASQSVLIMASNCVFGDVTDTLHSVYTRTGGTPTIVMYDCEIKYCTVAGINSSEGRLAIQSCWIHHNAIGINWYNTAQASVTLSLITDNTGDGIKFNHTTGAFAAWTVSFCTIDGNGGDGIDASTNGNAAGLMITNNIISNNANYGFRGQSGGTGSDSLVALVDGNAYYNNTSGHRTGLTAGANDVDSVDPGYTNAGSDDYSISSASLKGKGVPLGGTRKIGANNSGTYSYSDIGAAQAAASGGGLLIHGGMTGGFRG